MFSHLLIKLWRKISAKFRTASTPFVAVAERALPPLSLEEAVFGTKTIRREPLKLFLITVDSARFRINDNFIVIPHFLYQIQSRLIALPAADTLILSGLRLFLLGHPLPWPPDLLSQDFPDRLKDIDFDPFSHKFDRYFRSVSIIEILHLVFDQLNLLPSLLLNKSFLLFGSFLFTHPRTVLRWSPRARSFVWICWPTWPFLLLRHYRMLNARKVLRVLTFF